MANFVDNVDQIEIRRLLVNALGAQLLVALAIAGLLLWRRLDARGAEIKRE
jgi:hypothetical protein